MKKLPVGIQSFEKIQEEGYLYIDKTRYIWELIDRGKYYFLSRPRRFGKSLLISTLRCLFEGRRELFKGLWIENHWDWDKKYPVIVIDFNEAEINTPEKLQEELHRLLKEVEKELGIEEKIEREGRKSLKGHFITVLLKAREKFQEDVVILVDEYDKAIISHLGLGEKHLAIAKENRRVLQEFFGVIKGQEVARITKFVFFTGVSKFSKINIFSELNNLEDITMVRKFSTLLGITQEELEEYFSDYIHQLGEKNNSSYKQTLALLQHYYNGYRFSKENIKVYNPFSILRCLKENELNNYWFETGTPTFLVNLIKENEYYIPRLEGVILRDTDFSTYEIESLNLNSLLFQTGYITIKEVVDKEEGIFSLGYPNLEVKKSFLEVIYRTYTQQQETIIFSQIKKYLQSGKIEETIKIIQSLYAGISYPLSQRLNEAYFHSLFYLIMSGAGIWAQTEVLTSQGRIDLVIELKDKVYIIEFKCEQSSQKAIEQIKEKGYAQRYLSGEKKIYLVGINFSLSKRNIEEWKVVEV